MDWSYSGTPVAWQPLTKAMANEHSLVAQEEFNLLALGILVHSALLVTCRDKALINMFFRNSTFDLMSNPRPLFSRSTQRVRTRHAVVLIHAAACVVGEFWRFVEKNLTAFAKFYFQERSEGWKRIRRLGAATATCQKLLSLSFLSL